jgi:hypothetical protein
MTGTALPREILPSLAKYRVIAYRAPLTSAGTVIARPAYAQLYNPLSATLSRVLCDAS